MKDVVLEDETTEVSRLDDDTAVIVDIPPVEAITEPAMRPLPRLAMGTGCDPTVRAGSEVTDQVELPWLRSQLW